ncbi:MAG: PHP domain-containing protein [Armatimonadetes bacterium]|nr:PHP domain-containing protein [Armatimonadota bacterium]
MRIESKFFGVSPKVLPVGRTSVVTFRPLYDHVRFTHGSQHQVAIIPTEGIAGQTTWGEIPRQAATPVGGAISVPITPFSEQEYTVLIERIDDRKPKLIAEFRLCAVDEDLFRCRPWKGDLHVHTHHSDGKESPAYVAGKYRRAGFDFMAVTDHRKYAPSLDAIQAYDGVPIDLGIYPGEEVHPPDNPVHIVNFGGRFSINELFDTDEYRSEVGAIEKERGVPYQYASCVWCFDKIREADGLGIFCHPYWITQHRYDVPLHLTDMIFARQPYDAFEIIGGFFRGEYESNKLQVARYEEERAQGKRIPIVGSSDSHGTEQSDLFGWYYTIVFSPTPDLPDIIGGIKGLNSVAVEAITGESPRAFGPFRLVKCVQYLLREVFPIHDELCVEEGRLMLAHAAGDLDATEMLGRLQGRVRRLYDDIWGVK